MSKGLLDGLRLKSGDLEKKFQIAEDTKKSIKRDIINEIKSEKKKVSGFNSAKRERNKKEITTKILKVAVKAKYLNYIEKVEKPENYPHKRFGTSRKLYKIIDEHKSYKDQIDKQCQVLKTSIKQLKESMSRGDQDQTISIASRIKTFALLTKFDDSFLMDYLSKDDYDYFVASRLVLERNELGFS